MEPKPKERIVFDEDSYYGDEGEKMAIDDLMERDGLTEGEVREDFTDDEIFNHQMEMKDFDYEEEMRALAAFFNGEKSDILDTIRQRFRRPAAPRPKPQIPVSAEPNGNLIVELVHRIFRRFRFQIEYHAVFVLSRVVVSRHTHDSFPSTRQAR